MDPAALQRAGGVGGQALEAGDARVRPLRTLAREVGIAPADEGQRMAPLGHHPRREGVGGAEHLERRRGREQLEGGGRHRDTAALVEDRRSGERRDDGTEVGEVRVVERRAEVSPYGRGRWAPGRGGTGHGSGGRHRRQGEARHGWRGGPGVGCGAEPAGAEVVVVRRRRAGEEDQHQDDGHPAEGSRAERSAAGLLPGRVGPRPRLPPRASRDAPDWARGFILRETDPDPGAGSIRCLCRWRMPSWSST